MRIAALLVALVAVVALAPIAHAGGHRGKQRNTAGKTTARATVRSTPNSSILGRVFGSLFGTARKVEVVVDGRPTSTPTAAHTGGEKARPSAATRRADLETAARALSDAAMQSVRTQKANVHGVKLKAKFRDSPNKVLRRAGVR